MQEKESSFCGVKIFVNPNDTAGNIILKGDNPEQVEINTILKNIKEDSIMVDVGACYGEYTLLCAKKANKGKVIAVEPNPYHFKLLKKSVEANRLENVILINKALSDDEGMMSFYMGNNHLEGSTLFKDKMIQELGNNVIFEEIQVEVITLDTLLQSLSINKIDILKIDAEGAELKIIKGAEKTLKESTDLKMLTEFGIHSIASSGESPVEYLTYLTNRFKEVRILRDGKELGDRRDIIDKNNIRFKYKIVCTNLFCR